MTVARPATDKETMLWLESDSWTVYPDDTLQATIEQQVAAALEPMNLSPETDTILAAFDIAGLTVTTKERAEAGEAVERLPQGWLLGEWDEGGWGVFSADMSEVKGAADTIPAAIEAALR